MPPDLLKFIQDVGPAKQTIDKEYTSSRLLENKEELDNVMKNKSSTPRRRQRMQMPLMGEDDTFTTEKNTNFSRTTAKTSEEILKDPTLFGLDHLGLYELLVTKDNENNNTDDTIVTSVDDFYNKITKEEERKEWPDKDQQKHKERLQQALNVIDYTRTTIR